ncbi:hypothetical protein [Sporosarcina koreensis]|uniref:Uncharacterized protein n=1 Tax=Sporosarcina koreensis TaxID=334735 RepID=A0ABW0TVC2_9BACL
MADLLPLEVKQILACKEMFHKERSSTTYVGALWEGTHNVTACEEEIRSAQFPFVFGMEEELRLDRLCAIARNLSSKRFLK